MRSSKDSWYFFWLEQRKKQKKMVSGLYTNIPFIYKYSLCRSIIGSNFLKKYFPPLNKKKIPAERIFFFNKKWTLRKKKLKLKLSKTFLPTKLQKSPFLKPKDSKQENPKSKPNKNQIENHDLTDKVKENADEGASGQPSCKGRERT